ncbi:hypothetical protein GB881_19320 [Georgenia subflava]|uniref:Uncharacterized protein n=1 Tax=Georgenia subflava TaxID=1622177 RepID=A0A6N7EPV8_9MICO|nr:hypothetical protein [Georgenia subflava]
MTFGRPFGDVGMTSGRQRRGEARTPWVGVRASLVLLGRAWSAVVRAGGGPRGCPCRRRSSHRRRPRRRPGRRPGRGRRRRGRCCP